MCWGWLMSRDSVLAPYHSHVCKQKEARCHNLCLRGLHAGTAHLQTIEFEIIESEGDVVLPSLGLNLKDHTRPC